MSSCKGEGLNDNSNQRPVVVVVVGGGQLILLRTKRVVLIESLCGRRSGVGVFAKSIK